MTGTTILHYKIGDKLGGGGMGEVYRAEDTRLGRPVALKFLSPESRADPEKRARLFQEARAASALRSPNIAVTYDIVEHQESLFIAMEYVEGESLARRLETAGVLPARDVADIGAQTADALAEAHGRGVIHRDIKAANIIVTPRGLVKVLDFGIAKLMRSGRVGPDDPTAAFSDVDITSPGVILGTVSYMSPEQALGRPLDPRSDIFSLGVLLYQMATGALPFTGRSTTEVIDNILHHDPLPAHEVQPAVPADLSGIVRQALAKDPAARHQSARALHDALVAVRDFLDGCGCAEDPAPGSSGGAAPGATRASGAGSGPGSGAGSGNGNGNLSRTPNAAAVMTFVNITREPADDWIGTGIAETVTADLQHVRGLSVIGRARIYEVLKNLSSSQLDVLDEHSAMDLGRRLGAAWVIGGGYQRLGPAIRITAHLVDVSSGALQKTVKVDGQMAEIFQLQDRIVYDLTQGLSLQLGTSEMAEIEERETSSVEAYENHSLAMINLRTGSPESLDRAVLLLEKAIDLDPGYAAAWAGLGSTYLLKAAFLGIQGLFEKAAQCERRALALRPRLAMAHAALGSALAGLGRFDEGVESIREAVRLDPSDSLTHSVLGRVYWLGKGMFPEAIEALEKAASLNPDAGYALLQLGLLYAIVGDLDRAERACKLAIGCQERLVSGRDGMLIVGGYSRLGYVYYRRGQHEEAIREYEREAQFLARSEHALRERGLIEIKVKLGAALLRQGRREEALQALDGAIEAFESRLSRGADEPFTRYYIGVAHALRGAADAALEQLQKAAQRVPAMIRARARLDPDLEALRDEPRFQGLVGAA